MGTVKAVCLSSKKGARKINMQRGTVVAGYGIEGDAHAGSWHRQVSLLAMESIEKMRRNKPDLCPGDFAENITTEGIELTSLPLGTLLKVGFQVILEVTQIGKKCHGECEIFKQIGDCVMPREGVFARVLVGGVISEGDSISVQGNIGNIIDEERSV